MKSETRKATQICINNQLYSFSNVVAETTMCQSQFFLPASILEELLEVFSKYLFVLLEEADGSMISLSRPTG